MNDDPVPRKMRTLELTMNRIPSSVSVALGGNLFQHSHNIVSRVEK
jgi:hypothetical protein